LERGRLVTAAIRWKAPHESGRGALLMPKRWQLQKAGRAIYWRKQKGHASRRTQNKQSLQQQMADSSRLVDHSLRYTFTKLSPDSLFFFLFFDETTTPDAEGLTETVLHLNLGFVFGFCFSLLMRK
jgi:RES domain-containing protein